MDTPKMQNRLLMLGKIAGLLALAVATRIWSEEVTHLFTPHEGRPPVVWGFLMVGTLIFVFGSITWWLYFSPLKQRVEPDNSDAALRRRWRVGGVLVISSILFVSGGVFDTLWHLWLGGFGNDFLWLPHQFIYGSLLLNLLVAGGVLIGILRRPGSMRVNARREPALGVAALASGYAVFSTPSDVLWHQIYGIDITPWSLPHILIFTMGMCMMIATIRLLTTSRKSGEQNRFLRIGVFSLAACLMMAPIILAMSDYEFGGAIGLNRPGWVFPMLMYLIGSCASILIASLTKQKWTATILASIILVAHGVLVLGAFTLSITFDRTILGHLYIIIPAIAFDIALIRLRARNNLAPRQQMLRAGLVYWAVYWPVALISTVVLQVGSSIMLIDVIIGPAIGLVFLLAFGMDIYKAYNPEPNKPPSVERPLTVQITA